MFSHSNYYLFFQKDIQLQNSVTALIGLTKPQNFNVVQICILQNYCNLTPQNDLIPQQFCFIHLTIIIKLQEWAVLNFPIHYK